MQTSQYNTVFNQDQVNQFKAFEARLQTWMDDFYKGLGYRIVNRKGNIKRDLVLASKSGKTTQVEEKYRTRVWNDCLIELMQDIMPPMSRYKWGWLYCSGSDQLINIFCDSIDAEKPTRIYSVNMPKLKGQLPSLVDPKIAMAEASYSGDGLTQRDVSWLRRNAKGVESNPTVGKFIVSSKGKGLSLSLVLPWNILIERDIAKKLL